MKKKIVLMAIIVLIIGLIVSGIFYFLSPNRMIKSGKIIDSWEVLYGETEPYEYTSFMEVFASKATYKVDKISINIDGVSGTAQITITAPDLEKIITQSIETYAADTNSTFEENKESMEKNIIDSINNNAPIKTTTFSMDIKREDGKWKLVENNEWTNAANGDISNLYYKLYEQMLSDLK